MKVFRYLIINLILVAGISILIQPQEISNRKRHTEVKYILSDSTGSYLIRETTAADGTKTYNLIPKSSPHDTVGAIRDIPETLNDWFYKNKKRNGIVLLPITPKQDTLDFSFNLYDKSDSSAVAAKDNDSAWWIIGTTTVVSGIVAYLFLQYKKPLDELPIQPDPPRY